MAAGAHQALRYQGYSEEDIYYLSGTTTTGVDDAPTLSNIEWALTTWAAVQTQDLIVYLTGPGGNALLTLGGDENLPATQLDVWLDALQTVLPGTPAVIYDADYAGTFLPELAPPAEKQRITAVSTGTGQSASFFLDGTVSFSSYFWRRIADGDSLGEAFSFATRGIRSLETGQESELDDNGDGIFNAKQDGILARDYAVGAGILMAGDDPLIGAIVDDQSITSSTAAIWVVQVIATSAIDQVFALIHSPQGQAHAPVELFSTGDDAYGVEYNGFNQPGTYRISVFAIDANGRVSLPAGATVNRVAASLN